MPTTTTSGVPSLGEHRWNRIRALCGSVGLHALVIAGLLAIHQGVEPSNTTTPSIVLIDLVYLRDDGTDSGGRVPDTDVVVDDPEPAERALEVRSPAEAEPPPAVEPAPVDTATEIPDPLPAAPATEAQAPTPAERATGPAPIEVTEPLVEPTVAVGDPIEPTAPPEAAGAPEPKPETVQIAREQRRMLDRKLASWSARLDELPEEEISWQHRGQEYSARFTRESADDNMGIEHVVVAVTTEQDGNRWSTAMRMKRMAFSSFAQFVDRWDSNVQIHDDEIDGRFHSNSEIYIANSGGVQPAFRGKVTTSSKINTSNSTRRVRREEVFLGGLETRVRRIRLPTNLLPFPTQDDVDPRRLRRFDADTRISFYADGSYAWQALDEPGAEHRVALSDEPHYLLADDDASLFVKGVVNGKVLVYAPEDIVIEDDLVYAADPSEVPDSGDYLGLVANHNVVIADPETTGPGDLTVQAAIYAKSRFLVRRYGAHGPATLHVFGSVAAGALSATEPRFRTKLEFDPRLEEARPPGFPMTDRYELVAWDGLWVEDAEP